MTLTEQAMAVTSKRRNGKVVEQEQVDLALAWVRGTVSITQIAGVLGVKSGSVYPFLARALRQVCLGD